MDQNIIAILANTNKIGKRIDSTLNNTATLGAELEKLQAQVISIKSEINKLLSNQQIMNENLLRILDKLS